MGRSLYAALHRRYGRRLRGADLKRRADFHRERLRSVLPVGLLEASRASGASPGTVAVVGGGLAGAAAAFTLNLLGFGVTVFDGGLGGRVSTQSTLVPNRLLETGAELIGINHPLWLLFSDLFGLGMSVVTPDDDFAAQGLEMPLFLGGQSLNPFEQEALYNQMTEVYQGWCAQAGPAVPNPWAPWTAPNAATLDSANLAAQMPSQTGLLFDAVNTTFVFNNLQPMSAQSWLANLAQFAAGADFTGGDVTGFFDDTENFRCASGNQSLLQALLFDVDVNGSNVTDLDTTGGGVALTLAGGVSGGTFDYAVFAAPVSVFPVTTVDGGSPFPWNPVQAGYACKYLAPLDNRFWIGQGLAPSGMSDQAGMTWEATDNQMALPGQTGSQYCLTLFTGGPIAQQAVALAQSGGTGWADAYFEPLIAPMYPGIELADNGGTFCCGAGGLAPYLMSGYSCPAPGQVTTIQASYATPYNGVLFLAGEHTSPAWFGFMEGALESGLAAAVRLAVAAGVEIPSQAGGLEGALVQLIEQDAADILVGEATGQ
ncbi:MAG TPA: FAD-dependent oxidoreductase [Longimicrobium sp.]|nr:FAD-dependent oxidoreductase [Longimicrobium sp.]